MKKNNYWSSARWSSVRWSSACWCSIRMVKWSDPNRFTKPFQFFGHRVGIVRK